MFKRFSNWIVGLFSSEHRQSTPDEPAIRSKPPVSFQRIQIVSHPPKNDEIESGGFYCVFTAGNPKWALFRCPCKCGSVVTLSLQPVHNPSWVIIKAASGKPTLHPSVWRDKGCLSHFWIREGIVFWCADTGTHPDLRSFKH